MEPHNGAASPMQLHSAADKSPVSDLPPKSREEGELSSDENDENSVSAVAHSTGTSVLPSVNKLTLGNKAGKTVSPASSADMQTQVSKQPTSQKINDANRVALKAGTPGWRPPRAHSGPNNLVISFSDDDSQSDSEDKEHGKLKTFQTRSNVTRVNVNGKPPISSIAKPNKLGQPARNVNKVMPKKVTMSRTFITSVANIRGVNSRDSVPSSVEQGSRVGNFNSINKNIVNRERGHELQDLRQQIALKETELKLKESELKLKSAQRTKESVTCKDDNAKGLHRDGTGKYSPGCSDGVQIEPKEPDKKRLKVSGAFSTQLSALTPQELPVPKPIVPSRTPALEDNTQFDASKIQKEIKVCPTESSIVKWQNPNDRLVAGMSGNIHTGLKNGAGSNAKYIQSDGRGKQTDSFVTPNQAKPLADMMCIEFPNKLLNHTNRNTNSSHPEPGSSLNNPPSEKSLMRRGDHQETISVDKRLEPSSTSQALLNDTTLLNCFGTANITGDDSMKMQSLVQMEEMLDKNLEEAQEHRRQCEIEEQKALKAYRKAQRALLEANARCDVLYRKRELYSADFRAYVIDNPSLLCSSRQNEQAVLGLDQANSLSENVNLIPMSSHQMPPEHNDCNLAVIDSTVIDSSIQCINSAQVPNLYWHLNGENIGSEPCSEPDASTSEPVPPMGSNGADGVCSPSNEPNGSANEDDTLSFENESVQPSSECHIVDKQKETDNESNGILSIDPNEESLLLEKALRSTLFAKLGTKNASKNSVVCDGTGIAMEREAENDARGEEPQKVNGSSPFLEVEKNQQPGIEGADGQEKGFTEAPLQIQREHSVEHLSLNSHSSGYVEDRCSFGVDHSLASLIFSPSFILSSAFGYMKAIDSNNVMEHQDASQQSGTSDTNIDEGACINSGKTQSSSTMVMENTLVKLCDREDGSYTTGTAVDPFWPLCMYELRGKCNNDECPWQHAKNYSTTDMSPHHHDNSEIADFQVGQTLCKEKCDGSKVPWGHNVMTLPTYLVGLSTLKADSYDSLLARRNGECWKKCFSLFLALSKSFQKDCPVDGPVSHGNDGYIEIPVSWNRQTLYFQSRISGVNQPDQALADNEQHLEKALLIFSQEVNALEGMKKALPVLSRALEADATSVVLWVFYLLIYYSNMKSVGKDDMFSCAVNYNDRSYELWIMFINSRMQLSDRLVTYDLALSALCCHGSSSAKDKMHASACILDLVLQMVDCLCMSGNVDRAIQKICGLFSAATNIYDPDSPLLTDIPSCLTSHDKCILGVCCVYLVIYRKLPDAVVLQFECQKELFVIEWPPIELTDNEKQRAVKLMEAVEDSVCQSLDKSELDLSLGHYFALNHLRCMAAIGSLERCSDLLGKYLKMFPSCLELVLISARAHQHAPDDSVFDGFEESLNNWPKEVPGIQCIWNQYVVYALQKGQFYFGKELIGRWFHFFGQVHCLQNGTVDAMECDNSDGSPGLPPDSVLQTHDTDSKQMDIMFEYLNLSLYKFIHNDQIEARLALERALKAAVPEYSKHCMREHALFILSEESGFKENYSHSGMEKILKCYIGDAQAFPSSEPLSRKFVADIKKPRVRQLVSTVFSPLSSDFGLVNSVLEVWYGPSLLPKNTGGTKCLVDFVEAILDITPSNYQLAMSVCKLLISGNNVTDITSVGVLFWASSNLVNAIFHAVPIPPEYVWAEAAEILGSIVNVEVISERFYKRALSVYPFSVRLWKSYYLLSMMTTGNMNAVVETAKEKGIELD